MKIIESHDYISWSVVSCDKELSDKFRKALSKHQAHSVNCSENRKQFNLKELWESICSRDLGYEPRDAAIVAKFIEMNASYIDVSFDSD